MIKDNLKQILSNVSEAEAQKKFAANIAAGHIPLRSSDTPQNFTKIAWDVYKRTSEPDKGSIWTVADIDGEQWLVVQTDDNDIIMRNVHSMQNEERLSKTASASMQVLTAIGDRATVNPPTGSINSKYKGVEGTVVAAFDRRSKLEFDDGYTMWFENNHLSVASKAGLLKLGDNIRLKRNTSVGGRVIKISHDNIVSFETRVGHIYSEKLEAVAKVVKGQTVIERIWTDEPQKVMKYLTPEQIDPHSNSPGNPESAVRPSAGPGADSPSPSPSGGSPSPSGGSPSPAGGAPPPGLAHSEGRFVHGRVININDPVMNKTDGKQGHIVDIRVDRKWGKYYMVDYGDNQPIREFETILTKIPTNKPAQVEIPPAHMDYTNSNAYASNKFAQSSPAMETLRGGGTQGAPNVEPLTWETGNGDKGREDRDKHTDALTEEFLDSSIDEEMDSPTEMGMGGDEIVIRIDPVSKKLTVDFGGEEEGGPAAAATPDPIVPENAQIPPANVQPGSPGSLAPGGAGQGTGGEFKDQQIGVAF